MAAPRRHLQVIAAMGVAYGPGFLLPFLVVRVFDAESSDVVVLTTAAAVTVGSVLGLPLEAAWAAAAARLHIQHKEIGRADLAYGVRRSVVMGMVGAIVLLPLCILPYVFSGTVRVDALLASTIAISGFPVFYAIASVSTGILNAQGSVATGLLLQTFRSSVPFIGLLVIPMPDTWHVGVLLACGESVRAVLAYLLVARTSVAGTRTGCLELPQWRALLAHSAGLTALGSAPITNRAFIASTGVGAAATFEMADRVFFAASQIGYNALVLPRTSVVARKLSNAPASTVMTDELRRSLLLSVPLGATAAVTVLVMTLMLPEVFMSSAGWAMLLLLSLPAAVSGAVATRILIAADRAALIPHLSVLGLIVNLLGNIVGVWLAGAVGVLLSTVLYRYMLLLATWACVQRARATVPGRRKVHISSE